MKPGRTGHSLFKIAPAMLGAICLALVGLLASCEPQQTETPSAEPETEATPESHEPVAQPEPPAGPEPAPIASRQGGRPRGGEPVVAPQPEPAESDAVLRFVSFNLKNWLTMERYSKGKKLPGRMKPDEEKAAVVATIIAAEPDVLGVSEIGTQVDLEDLRNRLTAAGCDSLD